MALGELHSVKNGPASAVTETFVMGKDVYWLLLPGDKVFYTGPFGWLSQRGRSPRRLSMRWCVRSRKSYSGTKLLNDVTIHA